MSNPTRVIARLDIKGPNVIKGIQFDGYRVLGSPEYFAEAYYEDGIDELVFQDVVASLYQRNSLLDVIRRTANKTFIPLTVAGGIRTIDDIREILRAGADKVAINTAAVQNPALLAEGARIFGNQCIVASIEAYRHTDGRYEIWTDYGRQQTGIDALEWAKRVVEQGAGEILVTSINREGTGRGYDVELVSKISKAVPVPVIAAGGAGKKEDVLDVIRRGSADAVCVASLFHYRYAKPFDLSDHGFSKKKLRMGEHVDYGNFDFLNFGHGGYTAVPVNPSGVPELKKFLAEQGASIRL